MATSDYVAQEWTDGEGSNTPLDAARLTYMEDGIENHAHTQGAILAALAGAALLVGNVPGAPTAGNHNAGEVWIDSTGVIWLCTVAGNPGTWITGGSGIELGYFSSGAALAGLNSAAFAAVPGYTKVVNVPAGGRPIYVDALISYVVSSAASNVVFDILEDGVSCTGGLGCWSQTIAAGALASPRFRVRRTPPPGNHTYAVSYKTNAGGLGIATFGEPYDMSITLR